MRHLILTACILMYAIPLLSQNYWEEKQASPFLRIDYQGFSAGGKMYIVGGVGFDISQVSRETWEYNPATDGWTKKADFPGNKCMYAVGFELNGRGYMTTGSQFVGDYRDSTAVAADSNALWEYNPAADTWTRKADFPGRSRTLAFGFVLGGKAYVGGGTVGNKGVAGATDFWYYDPAADAWGQKADIPAAVLMRQSTAFADEHFGYAGLGDIHKSREFLQYNPDADSWTSITPFPETSVHQASGCFVHGKLYVVGGTFTYADFFGGYRKAFVYDPIGNTWDAAPPVRTDYPVTGIAANLQGELYYYGISKSPEGDVGRMYHLNITATDVVEDAQGGELVKAFPTPFNGVLHLQSSSDITDVTVYNMFGERVHSSQVRGRTAEIDGAGFAHGVYFAKVRTADGREQTVRTIRGE